MYRHLQARLKNNAESVAFYGGIDKEGRIINSRFKELLRHHGRILTKQWQFGMVQVCLLSIPVFCVFVSSSALRQVDPCIDWSSWLSLSLSFI